MFSLSDFGALSLTLRSAPYLLYWFIKALFGSCLSFLTFFCPSSPDDKRQRSLIAQDRISALPEPILLHILSFLPIQDAIKTCVLSKTWANIWTFLPSLSFKSHFFLVDEFASFVDDTLKLHRAPKLSKFFLEFEYDSTSQTRVDRWVDFATSAKVQQLHLNLVYAHNTHYEAYVMPQHLYVSEFITALDLCVCNIVPNGSVNWSSLKRLSIKSSTLTMNAMRKVLLGSPRLEFLELYALSLFYKFWNGDQFEPVLVIESESLRKLVIREEIPENYSLHPTLVFEIVAPNIQALEILGCFGRIRYRLKDVASLVEAKIDFDMFTNFGEDDYTVNIATVRRLLEDLHHVKELTVGRWFLSVLSIYWMKHLPFPLSKCTLSNCKCVTVITGMEKWDLLGIISMLQSLPYLETLVVDMLPPFKQDLMLSIKSLFNSDNYDGESSWKSKEMFLECLQLHLKTVEIFGFEEWFYRNELFILLTQFLLKNSSVLEKMVIRRSRFKQIQKCHVLHEFLNVTQKLLSFPRSSPHAVVLFPSQ